MKKSKKRWIERIKGRIRKMFSLWNFIVMFAFIYLVYQGISPSLKAYYESLHIVNMTDIIGKVKSVNTKKGNMVLLKTSGSPVVIGFDQKFFEAEGIVGTCVTVSVPKMEGDKLEHAVLKEIYRDVECDKMFPDKD